MSRTVLRNCAAAVAAAALLLPTAQSTAALAAPADVQGSVWHLAGIAPELSQQASFSVDAAGRVGVTSPCNLVGATGTALVGAYTIDFPLLNTTRMGCETDRMAAEHTLLTALDTARYYSVSGDTLTLVDRYGTTTTFVR